MIESDHVIGLDLGSHLCSFAIWNAEKDAIDVIADDTGSRVIPTTIAFRGDEVLIGQAAVTQQHKNGANTFEDLRSLLFRSREVDTVSVPVLEKELPISELLTHFFRNIHNQVKEQVGSVVRDCCLSIPFIEDEEMKGKLIAAAQAGGIRVKSIIDDSAAILLAYGLDDSNIVDSNVFVLDVGWTKTSISIYAIRGGVFYLIGEATSYDVSGGIFVNLLAEHCAKDFMRKAKFSCADNVRSMLRLKKECEIAVKSLSTGAETTVTVDSLCEGIDYSTRISRARFEDLCSIPFMRLRSNISNLMSSLSLTADGCDYVCIGGGSSTVPRVLSIMKDLFPGAAFPKLPRLELAEALCVGAAMHGRNLKENGLLAEMQKLKVPDMMCTNLCIAVGTADMGPFTSLVPRNVPLPYQSSIWLSTIHTHAYFQIVAYASDELGMDEVPKKLGDIVFPVEGAAENDPVLLRLVASASLDGNVEITVYIDSNDESVFNVTLPV